MAESELIRVWNSWRRAVARRRRRRSREVYPVEYRDPHEVRELRGASTVEIDISFPGEKP